MFSSQNKKYGQQLSAPIIISYRKDQGKKMHGAFYDHYLFRKITQHKTKISTYSTEATQSLKNFVESMNHTFVLGIGTQLGDRIMPSISMENDKEQGLLFIPGFPRDNYEHERKWHENALIQKALLNGQPILGICGGSWALWRNFQGKFTSVKDHSYAKMPYITLNGFVGNNVQVHEIKLKDHTLLKSIMSLNSKSPSLFYPTVNSVHWDVADDNFIPDLLEVSATARQGNVVPPNSRQGEIMAPDEDTIEAFESKFGAPILGIQWHPEAYYKKEKDTTENDKRNLNILKFMAKAGDAYLTKKKMLSEFKQKYTPSLTHVGFFKTEKNHKTLTSPKILSSPANKRIS